MEGTSHLWWHEEWLWAMVAAIVQILLLASIPTSLLLYRKDERNKFYIQLDDTYRHILEMGLEDPELLKPSVGKSNQKYDIFAFIVWNFLETIHDYCRNNKKLMETWRPIIASESATHSEWFTFPQNRSKFKPEFCEYMDNREWQAIPENFFTGLLRHRSANTRVADPAG